MSNIKYFTYKHLPEHLRTISQPCCEIAEFMVEHIEPSEELKAGIRHLMEAKDCFVRAGLKVTDHGIRADTVVLPDGHGTE